MDGMVNYGDDAQFDADAFSPDSLLANAQRTANFLKALSHPGRLLIMCHLASGERSVMELETLLDIRQAAVSQQLARLRIEGLVVPRRDGKVIYYKLADEHAWRLVRIVRLMFDMEDSGAQTGGR